MPTSIPDLLTGDDAALGGPSPTPPSQRSSRSGTPSHKSQQQHQAEWGTSSGHSSSSSAFLSFPIARVGSAASSLYRRMTDPDSPPTVHSSAFSSTHTDRGSQRAKAAAAAARPQRSASPFAPPPLTGLSLTGWRGGAPPPAAAQVLGRVLAEEIRLLLPPRLQLQAEWAVAFSVAQDGVSLSTLYARCAEAAPRGRRGGWVLAVRDGAGGVFGAFLSDLPAPSPSYYGTGECFLWRATVLPAAQVLAALPPPPSEDTTGLSGRSTTLSAGLHKTQASMSSAAAADDDDDALPSGVTTPDRIRFKAFPYSGVNDYLIYCEHDYLSVGGGDGRYGLWLDSNLERGVSAPCMTFGNEALSDEGTKFEVIGVELWFVSA